MTEQPQEPWDSHVGEIDDNSWLICNRVIISRVDQSDPACLFTEPGGSGFTVTSILPWGRIETRPLSESSAIQFEFTMEDSDSAWSIGSSNVRLKVSRDPTIPGTTSPFATLKWLSDGRQWSFNFGKLFHYERVPGFEVVVMRDICGGTRLDELWPSLDSPAKQSIADKIVGIQQELAFNSPQSIKMTGADGGKLCEPELAIFNPTEETYNFNSDKLEESCRELGMTCSYFLFTNLCVMPYHFIIDTETGTIGLEDWNCCGFFPVEWIATKPLVSMESHLCGFPDDQVWEFRTAMARTILRSGMPHRYYKYLEWEERNKPEAGPRK